MVGTHRSHYLSRYYLGGFTTSGRKEDKFWVSSKSQGRTWPMRAEKAGHKRDLFRWEGTPEESDAVESAFGSIEGEIAPVLREVIGTQSLPTEDRKLYLLLHLPALNAARPPAEIKSIADASDEALRSIIVDRLTPTMHERVLEDWKAQGRDTSGIADLDDVKDRIEAGRIRVLLPQNHLLTLVLGRATILVDILHQRSWTLLRTDEEVGYFVCSDRPVCLMNNMNLPRPVQPRFDDARFDVIMPLSKTLCMIGHIPGPSANRVAQPATVRFINYMTVASAEDFVYSPTREYGAASADEFRQAANESYAADVLFHRR